MQSPRLRLIGFCVVAIGILAAGALCGFWFGKKHVRDRYEIWYSSLGTFESTLVDAGQNANALARIHEGNLKGAEYVLLSRIKYDLDIVHALVEFAPERDRDMAEKVVTGIFKKIGDTLPTTNVVSSDYHEALRLSTALHVRRQLESFTNGKTVQTNTPAR